MDNLFEFNTKKQRRREEYERKVENLNRSFQKRIAELDEEKMRTIKRFTDDMDKLNKEYGDVL